MEDRPYHLIGIGGIGMSGLARILLQRGKKVSGSDVKSSSFTERLSEEGAQIFIGHEASQVLKETKIVYTSAVQSGNPEYEEAKRLELLMLHRSELLAELMKGSSSLLVTGTHGKTTTSSLLAHVLVSAGEKPSYSIGGIVQSLGAQACHGEGKWFVAEADESDGSFLAYSPVGAIVTNIDLDHLDYWKTEESLIQGFVEFQRKVENRDLLFWCADDPLLAALSWDGVGYGFSSSAELKIENAVYLGWKSQFDLRWKGFVHKDIEIPLIGHHNVLNAAAVFGLCLQIGIDETFIYQAMKSFKGAGRRAEKKGEVRGIAVYDDYAHHPTEIATTLSAMRVASEGRRIVVLIQPHRFSRTRDCFDLFADSFKAADLIFLTDVYGAGECSIEGIHSQNLQEKIVSQGVSSCVYVPKEDLLDRALSCILPGDVVVTMGAGDITSMGPKLLERLSLCL